MRSFSTRITTPSPQVSCVTSESIGNGSSCGAGAVDRVGARCHALGGHPADEFLDVALILVEGEWHDLLPVLRGPRPRVPHAVQFGTTAARCQPAGGRTAGDPDEARFTRPRKPPRVTEPPRDRTRKSGMSG